MSKKTKTTNELQQLIETPSGEIKALLDRLAKIQALNNTLQAQLSATLIKHCRVINLRKNILVIAADSPVWANKLRFLQAELLTNFRESGYYGLASIEIIVQPR